MGALCDYCKTVDLYERLGREQGVELIIRRFCEKVAKDDRLNKIFVNTVCEEHIEHLIRYFMAASGGPDNYTGRAMEDAHAHVNNG